MSERELLEKVVKGLECHFLIDMEPCVKCPYYKKNGDINCTDIMAKDALELLKAREPRVLTLDEYRAIAEKPRSMREPVWIEWRDGGYGWAIPQRAYEVYGVDWLAWTDRPTDEMREATAWA